MAYTYAKLNWKPEDYFEIDDWIRIRNNAYAVLDELIAMQYVTPGTTISITNITGDLALPYYDDVNTMETSVQKIYSVAPWPFPAWKGTKSWTYRTSVTWSTVGNPTNLDFNRWEEFLVYLWGIMDFIKSGQGFLISGTCYSGNDVRVQHFTRGRYSG